MSELTDEELLYASEEDWAFYNKIIEGLPTMTGKNGDGKDKYGEYIPYHSGPHILRHLRDTIEIVKPKSILEIGFNMGHSSSMWLNLCDAAVYSIDVSEKDETINGATILVEKFPGRFRFNLRKNFPTHRPPLLTLFDMCFIDGAHDDKNITEDIRLCNEYKIPYLLFDDWYPRYGETQKAVAKFPELELVKDMNNLRLYKFNYDN